MENLFSLRSLHCVLMFVSCYTSGLQAQSYIVDVQKLSVEDGLSNRFTRSVYRDSRGFIWIGTYHGLNRYDGYRFKHYTKENSRLSTNRIDFIHEDDRQNLWTIQVTKKGKVIDILDMKTGRFRNFDDLFKTLAPFKAKEIYKTYSEADKTLWFMTRAGKLYRYKNKHFEYIYTIFVPDPGRLEFFYAGNDFLWIYQWTPIRRLTGIDLRTGIAKTFDIDEELLFTGIDDTRVLWLFQPDEKRFSKLDWEQQKLESVTMLPHNFPDFASSVTFTDKSYLNPPDDFLWWLSISDKRNIGFPVAWQLQENVQYDFRDNIAPLLSYGSAPAFVDACLDTENRLWLATDDGIFILSLKKNKFTTITAANGENYSARGIVEDNNGAMYVSTYSGGLQLYPQKNKLKTNVLGIARPIVKDREGMFWISAGQFTIRYDPLSKKKWYYLRKSRSGKLFFRQLPLIHDARGYLWINTHRGLYTVEPDTGRFLEFTGYNSFPELKDSNIYYVQETDNDIWIATSSGLYLLESEKGITARYSTEQAPPYYIPHEDIFHFHRDSEGVFWLATRGGGLIRFDPASGSSQQFTTENGLSSNIIYAVYEDDYGKLWLPSNYGLMQFDKKSHQLTTWLKDDGIAHNEFNSESHYKASDGRMYFGGLAGVTIFHPKDFIAGAPELAPLRITRFQVLNGKTGQLTDKTTEITNTETLELSPSDKSLLVEFALLNFKNTQTNTYAYKIEGLDADWTPIRTNSLRLSGLPYGNYTLRIKGQGIEGEQSANALSIALQVNKPFYLKNGFILGSILALLLLVYGIFRWRLQRLRRSEIRLKSIVKERTAKIRQQKDKLQELDSAKSRFFANISHELRTPLTLILGHLQGALKGRYGKMGKQLHNNLEVSRQNSRRLLTMIEEILDLSKMEAGKLELHNKPVKLYPLLDRLCDIFRSYLSEKDIRFTRTIALDPEMAVMLDEKKFGKIILNLLSNAGKFTPAGGSITLGAEEVRPANASENKDDHIRIAVRDSGIGIRPRDLPHIFDRFYQGGDKDTPMEGGTGIGLALSRELAELMGGRLNAESQWGEGSEFTFSFPKKEAIVLSGETVVETINGTAFPVATPAEQQITPVTAPRKEAPAILIVEDHPEMRNFIRQQLENDYRVLEAADGVEALETLNKEQPADLILSDVMMPRMDGFQLLSKLKANPATEDIPVIMLTARAAREDRLQALTIGVDDYLTKPFDHEELLARIRHSLKNRVKRQQWSARLAEGGKEALTADKQFLMQAETVVVNAISNHNYSIIDMAEDLNLSRRQLFRKIRAVTGLSPLQFIREIRLQKARTMLERKATDTVAEAMYATGFQKSDYFARVYHKRFGKLPSSYHS